jgi:hypothetical protein
MDARPSADAVRRGDRLSEAAAIKRRAEVMQKQCTAAHAAAVTAAEVGELLIARSRIRIKSSQARLDREWASFASRSAKPS